MEHDEDIGCGKHNGKVGHMSVPSIHNGWSSCSKREFLESYNYLEPRKKWCLRPGNTNYIP